MIAAILSTFSLFTVQEVNFLLVVIGRLQDLGLFRAAQ